MYPIWFENKMAKKFRHLIGIQTGKSLKFRKMIDF